jgi:hypothetical protein
MVWSIVHRVLEADREVAEEDLIARLTPFGLIERSEQRSRHVGPSVRALAALGLIESVNGKLRLATADLDDTAFRFAAAQRLLSIPNGADAWEVRPESKRLEYDLQVAVAWFCLQGIDSGLSAYTAAEKRLVKQLGAQRNLLRDQAPYNTLERWIEWLGLGGLTRVGGESWMVPDPTPLVRFALNDLVTPGTYMSMPEFLDRIADLFPWLPHGAVGVQVAARLRDVPDDSAEHKRVPECLSLALIRLEIAGDIALDAGDDPRTRLLLSLGGSERTPVARIARP